MPQALSSYKVFIASPGGLEAERKVFRDVLDSYNRSEAHARNCHFEPVGWEITLGGLGRPQSKINEDLMQCDFMVLVLWDRWGSPTGNDGKFSSGTEEEFKIAKECCANTDFPMQNIVVLFKAVDPRQLSDPGEQLKKVLNFRKSLEKSRELLFETFDTTDSFSEKIRRHISNWTLAHGSGNLPNVVNTNRGRAPAKKIQHFESRDTKDLAYIKRIEKAYEKGNLTDTEAALVKKVVAHKNIPAFYEYGLFLMSSDRLSDALDIFGEMHRFACEIESFSWAGSAMARMGGIYRIQQRYQEAEDALRLAINLKKKASDKKGEMSARIWLGDLMFKRQRWKESADVYGEALAICKSLGNEKIEADIAFKIAKNLVKCGDAKDAFTYAEEALSIYRKQKINKCLQSVKQWKKSNVRKLGAK